MLELLNKDQMVALTMGDAAGFKLRISLTTLRHLELQLFLWVTCLKQTSC